MPTASTAGKTAAPKPAPAPNGDFYQLVDHLTPEEKAIVKKVRTYMETKVQPVINKYWSDDAFPFELLPSFKEQRAGSNVRRARATVPSSTTEICARRQPSFERRFRSLNDGSSSNGNASSDQYLLMTGWTLVSI